MSAQELEVLIGMLRQGGPDLTAAPAQARQAFEEMLVGIPVPPDVRFSAASAGGVPGLWADFPGARPDRVLLYLHGGAFVIGTAQGYRPLWSAFAKAAGMRGLAIDYRLAPENPFPAAVEDCLAAYRWLLGQGIAPGSIAFVGDSAGGGLVVSTMIAARDAGLPMPAAAVAISPWVDLDCPGDSGKAAEDPALDREGLVHNAGLYLQGAAASTPLASPVNADLHGLAPLLIQVGSAEILLDDSVRLAGRAGAAGTAVRLEIWPAMVHVWHMFGFMLSEGREATAGAAAFIGEWLDD